MMISDYAGIVNYFYARLERTISTSGATNGKDDRNEKKKCVDPSPTTGSNMNAFNVASVFYT